MKTIADLMAIRDKMQSQINLRETGGDDEIKIVVGLATCGISAGAREVFNTFIDEIAASGLDNVKVARTGCLGMCKLEPMVEIFVPRQEKCTYVLVTADKAKKIFDEHIKNGRVVNDYLVAKE